MPAMYSIGYAAMCASEYGASISTSAMNSSCVQSCSDNFRRRCARAGRAADRRRYWIRDITSSENHRDTGLLFAVHRNITLLVQLQLFAKQIGIRLSPDANQHAAHGQQKRLQSIFAQNLNRFNTIR